MAQGRTPRGPLIAPYQYSVVPGHRIYPTSVPPFIPSQVEMNMNAEKTQTRAPRSLSYNPEQVPAPSVDYKKAPSAPKYPFTPRQVEINMNAERAQKERAIRAQEELAIEAQEEREMGGPPSSPELSPVRPAGHTQAPRPPEYPSIPSLVRRKMEVKQSQARMGVLPPNTSLHLTKQDVSTLVSANPSAGRPAPPAQAFGIDRAPTTSRVTSRTTVPSMLRENSLTMPPSSRQSQPLRTPHPAYDSFGTNLYESGTARIGQSTIYYNSQEYTWDEIQQALANAQEYGQVYPEQIAMLESLILVPGYAEVWGRMNGSFRM